MREDQTESHRKRTQQQNKAIHLFCEHFAKVLNDAGFEKRVYHEHIAKKGFDVPWSKDSVKEDIWKLLQNALIKKESTTELSTIDPGAIHQVLCREFADKFGIEVPVFPSGREQLVDE